MEELYNPNEQLIIGGDFNINFLDKTSKLLINLSDILQTFGLKIVLHDATRNGVSSKACLDNFFVSDDIEFSISNINLSLSDHFAQFLSVPNYSVANNEQNTYIWRRKFSDRSYADFLNFIQSESWESVFSELHPDRCFNKFFSNFVHYFELCFPLKRYLSKTSFQQEKWITPELIRMKDKLNMYSELSNNYPEFKQTHKEYQHFYLQQLQKAKQAFYDQQINLADNKNKATWKIINDIKNKPNSDKHKIILKSDDISLSCAQSADKFNEHFTRFSTDVINNSAINDSECTIPFGRQSLFFSPVIAQDVVEIVNKLKSSNVSSYDEISSNLLKKCRDHICTPLAYIINQSFEQGVFPYRLKEALVIPLFKKGDKHNVENFRPISILPTFSKIFEHAINIQLKKFLQKNKIINPYQHGFVENKSTDTALCEFASEITKCLDKKTLAVGLFVDFSSAFDTVDHKLLLNKLHRYGIRGVALDLIKSYLGDRKQRVKMPSGVTSNHVSIKVGVPQGSILGPILFVIFANDLALHLNCVNNILVCCYADDTNILVKSDNVDELLIKCNAIYREIVVWSNNNKLIINKNKTTIIHFRSIRSTQHLENICGISCSNSTKMLGVTIDCHLNWSEHISNTCSKLQKCCYSLRFLKNHCSKHVLLRIYHANFHSLLRFNILNWGTCASSSRILILQKRAIRIICGIRPRDSCKPFFKELRVLTVTDTYVYEVCCYVFKNKKFFPE